MESLRARLAGISLPDSEGQLGHAWIEFNQITPLDLPLSILESVKGTVPSNEESFRAAKRRVIEEFESRYLSEVLSETSGNVSEAARRCGMQRSAFQRLMAKYNLQTLEFRR